MKFHRERRYLPVKTDKSRIPVRGVSWRNIVHDYENRFIFMLVFHNPFKYSK